MEIRVFAPASVANIGVGYDILGFALQSPGDEVVARFSDGKGMRIGQITGTDRLPYYPEKNTATFSAQSLLNFLGKSDVGIELDIHKKMPFGSGLGSSAASAVAGVFAVNTLLGNPLTKKELLHFAVLGEQLADGSYHADNVAPSLLGGIILIRDNATLDITSLPIPDDLVATVIYPEVEVLTRDSRNILKPEISLQRCIAQTGNLASFIAGLYQSDYELIGRSLTDHIIEPQRAVLIPHFYEVKNMALIKGALGCSISGAGPSVFALFRGFTEAEKGGKAMKDIFIQHGISATSYICKINSEGAIVLS
jgi:homoserine kinase